MDEELVALLARVILSETISNMAAKPAVVDALLQPFGNILSCGGAHGVIPGFYLTSGLLDVPIQPRLFHS